MVGRARLVVAPVGSHEERESLTSSPEGLEGAEAGGVKRKSAPPETGSKFKVVGTMVVAMQRFQGPLAVQHSHESPGLLFFLCLHLLPDLLPLLSRVPLGSVQVASAKRTRSDFCQLLLRSRTEPASDLWQAS